MASFFRRLFETDQTSSQPEPPDADEVRTKSLLYLVIPQLQLLGLDLETVPAEGSYVSKRSRGYIYGMAGAVLASTTEKMSHEEVFDIMQTAFTSVWGAENAQRLYETTLAECAARDGETLAGAYSAEADVGEVYAGKPHAAAVGFWLLNNGLNKPDELMPAIENPRPLASLEDTITSVESDDPLLNLDEAKVKLLCDCFAQIILPQLDQLEIKPGQIEHSSLAACSQACGYVHGICSTLVDQSDFRPSDAYGVMLGLWAFDEMYGRLGQILHKKTLGAILNEDMSVMHGVVLAHEDFAAISEKRPGYAPSGFYQIASGSLFD